MNRCGVWPAHPIFRLIWSEAFIPSERLALSVDMKALNERELQDAANASVIAGWRMLTDKILSHCGEKKISISENEILLAAAEGGHVVAMREARRMGATDADRAAECAAGGGHVEAMREARSMGATNFNWALR